MSQKIDELLEQLLKLHPKYIDLSLNRLDKLLKKLDNPHKKLPPVIHIAGTNGKGSTLSYLRHILMEHEMSVHSYISPHLTNFNERIIISNNEIKTYKLNKAIEYVKKINNKSPITFFEIITAIAFYLFSQVKADFLILETGLGGRLDATNIIKKSLLNIITPIGIDHQEFLGEDIYKITNEKLGIIKKDSNIIIGKQKKIVRMHILRKLNKYKNNKIVYKIDFDIMLKKNNLFKMKYRNKIFNFKKPKLNGDHQIENATTAIASIFKLNDLGYNFLPKKIEKGIVNTKWPGRLELGSINNSKVYLDGAHNLDGASQLLQFFKIKKIKVWLIIGMLNNKNLNGFLKKIKPIVRGVVAISIPGEKNSFQPEEILKSCKELNLNCVTKNSIIKANNFLSKVIKPKTILITGSLYLVGKIRKIYL